MIIANSPYADAFFSFWKTPVGFSIGDYDFHHSLRHWINDGLMVLFFFVVGLELKRELVIGELKSFRVAALPVAAAIGGMVVPALLYLGIQWNDVGQQGWGIPMATDIAFVVGCLALLGNRVPHSLRIFLISLAVVDDVGAILVIAIGYTKELHFWALALGFVFFGLIILMARTGIRSIGLYGLVGVGVWFGFHESGIHPTIAGVLLGLLTPIRPWINVGRLTTILQRVNDFVHGNDLSQSAEQKGLLRVVERAARETISPVERLETALHPWVGFVVMPLFAFANAGVPIRVDSLTHSVSIAVVVGLVIGKPLGIFLVSWLAVRIGVATLPLDISWKVLFGGGVLAGIGFTMSLFIAGLALTDPLLDAAKTGVLLGSMICGVLGLMLLLRFLPKPPLEDATTV